MQTFLPHPNFDASVAALDRARLGKQRVEALQILAALRAPESGLPIGWINHPATQMWKGYESALAVYATLCIREWTARGYTNNMMEPYNANWEATVGWHPDSILTDARKSPAPPWLGNAEFHASHRAALLFKDENFYRQFNWSETPKLDYVWPTKEGMM